MHQPLEENPQLSQSSVLPTPAQPNSQTGCTHLRSTTTCRRMAACPKAALLLPWHRRPMEYRAPGTSSVAPRKTASATAESRIWGQQEAGAGGSSKQDLGMTGQKQVRELLYQMHSGVMR